MRKVPALIFKKIFFLHSLTRVDSHLQVVNPFGFNKGIITGAWVFLTFVPLPRVTG